MKKYKIRTLKGNDSEQRIFEAHNDAQAIRLASFFAKQVALAVSVRTRSTFASDHPRWGFCEVVLSDNKGIFISNIDRSSNE